MRQLLAELRDFNKERRRKAVYKLGMLGGEEALRALMVAVEDENEDTIVRGRAAQMLGKMRDSRAVTPLISALQAKGYQTPIHAAQALGHIGDKRAIVPLIKLRNQNENEGAQKAASAALVKLGYEKPESESESSREPDEPEPVP
ncbi:MAG: HEAT repeat domain-containing protein [Chloroflexota bacterium]